MAVLSAYRTSLDNILATAVDSSTWTSTIKDEALRLALDDLNPLVAYETSFSVGSTSYTQDLSTITDINQVIALAYPWASGGDFGKLLVEWRLSGLTSAEFFSVQPTSGQTIRVRYTKRHKIQDSDSAASTTVPGVCERLVLYAAAAWCCILRQRQVSENPASPEGAYGTGPQLAELARGFRAVFEQLAQQLPPLGDARYGSFQARTGSDRGGA
jgi:hypothetical protein